MSTLDSPPQRLYLMQVAYLPPSNAPVVCYLVQTQDGKNILIDSGLPAQSPPDFQPVMLENVVEQLAKIGLEPADIDMLISTHFDFDHCGNHDAFTQAEWVVQREHYDDAQTNPRFTFARPIWDQPDVRWRFVEGDAELFPGLNLIDTAGHVPGHQSVLIRLPETGAVLLTIDAVPTAERFSRERAANPLNENEAREQASTLKLLDLAEREHVALTIFGHDREQWEGLRKLPEFYA